MFRVIAQAANGYVGFSRKLAFEYARACRNSNRAFLIAKRGKDGLWRHIAEQVPA